MPDTTMVLAQSEWSDAAIKFGNTIGTLLVFAAVLLLVFYAAGRATGRIAKPLTILVFLGPAVLLLIVGLVIPAIRTAFLSFKNDDSTKYVGFKNYEWAFGNSNIQQVLLTTLLWIVIVPLVTTGLGLGIALLVDRVKGEAFYKSLIFMPMAISFVGASIIWNFVYTYRERGNAQIGLLNQVVIALGYKNPPNWLLTQTFLGIPFFNTLLLMVIMVWVQTGFAMVVLSAAIKAIPEEILEAARMDGATGFVLFRTVKIPMIRNTLVVVLTTVLITTLKVFDIVRTMTGGNYGTEVLANEMYNQSFPEFAHGRGAALAVILFAVVLPLIGYNIVQLRRERATR